MERSDYITNYDDETGAFVDVGGMSQSDRDSLARLGNLRHRVVLDGTVDDVRTLEDALWTLKRVREVEAILRGGRADCSRISALHQDVTTPCIVTNDLSNVTPELPQPDNIGDVPGLPIH